MDKVIYDVCSAVKHESISSIQWDDLSRRMFWPIQGSFGKELIIINEGMPEVAALFEISKGKKMRDQQDGCDEYEITVTGKQSLSQIQDVGSPVREVRLQGSGRALMCENSALPDAVSMKLKRTVEPALWSEADHEIEEEIEAAWSKIP